MAPALRVSILLSIFLSLTQLAFAFPRVQHTKRNGTCTTNQRKAWHNLTDTEKSDYISAELCLMNSPPKANITGALNRWDELQYVHIVQSNIIHDVGAFLPWHRLFMRAHEQLLQTECNYTGAQPYWDEIRDMGAMNESVVFDPDTGFGGNGFNGSGCVVDGPFQNLTLHLNQTSNYANYCLSRAFSETGFESGNQTYLDACAASGNYSAAWLCYKAKPHGAGHAGVSGTMLDVVGSPGDPLFYLHHTYLDRVWWQWQQQDLSTRLTDMNGRNVPLASYLLENNFTYPTAAILDYDGDAGNETTLNHNLWMVGVIPNGTVGEVMDLGGDRICAEYL